MQPELPKVELPKPPEAPKQNQGKDEILQGNQQNLEAGIQSIGSAGAEAGLNNFEVTQPQPRQTAQDNSSGSDDVDATTDTAVTSNSNDKSLEVQKTGTPIANPQTAEDKDDIEKVWVDRAKKIVQQTKGDPYMQERATSRLQADYMKKRFNKDVKLPEETK